MEVHELAFAATNALALSVMLVAAEVDAVAPEVALVVVVAEVAVAAAVVSEVAAAAVVVLVAEEAVVEVLVAARVVAEGAVAAVVVAVALVALVAVQTVAQVAAQVVALAVARVQLQTRPDCQCWARNPADCNRPVASEVVGDDGFPGRNRGWGSDRNSCPQSAHCATAAAAAAWALALWWS